MLTKCTHLFGAGLQLWHAIFCVYQAPTSHDTVITAYSGNFWIPFGPQLEVGAPILQ
jgi:hypothetical protein